MIDIRQGVTKKSASSKKLIEYCENAKHLSGILYIGYPILYIAGKSLTLDALLITKEYGLVIFDVIEGTTLTDRSEVQDDQYAKLKSLLTGHKELNIKRELAVDLDTVTFAPAVTQVVTQSFNCSTSNDELTTFIESLSPWENSHLYEIVISVLQSIIKLKAQTNRQYLKKENSRGSVVKSLEETIANLDGDQEKAIIEYYDGIQRIRGLAGSGKTIVLALKAAYLHTLNPNWKIAITFHTRALRNQFTELVNRFCIEKKGELPNWEYLQIIHAWGSPKKPGIYSNICLEHNMDYMDYRAADNMSPIGQNSFDYACSTLLNKIENFHTKYDVILVDEAQDLNAPFLKLCFGILNEPKRLIYAYDELQTLNDDESLPSPTSMFNRDADDIILEKCYRNSRPLLTTAHALGFGIYRDKGLVQFFDQPQLWQEVGYELKEGELKANSEVVLSRTEQSSPKYLEDHSSYDDLLVFKSCTNSENQSEWVASEIIKNLNDDELLHRDIIVINPLAWTTKREIGQIRSILMKNKILSHLAGEFDSDVFHQADSITFTGIYRAKGNEAPMVYVINAQDCFSGSFGDRELTKRRNILFTAITRSKAWVRVSGYGNDMNGLISEFNKVKSNNFELKFKYPSTEEIERMNVIHRDITESEKRKLTKANKTLDDFKDIAKRVSRGESPLEDYPEVMQQMLLKFFDDEDA